LGGIGYGVVSVHDFLDFEVIAFGRQFEFEQKVWDEI
jgi:hypothetical protein